ncbi:hypothetical protein TYRP_017798 [Tyrophagus putrescentiae]|nr:hypothetical protein TYRP_017798 [Tyrophagus putrescentiae]
MLSARENWKDEAKAPNSSIRSILGHLQEVIACRERPVPRQGIKACTSKPDTDRQTGRRVHVQSSSSPSAKVSHT